MDFYFTYLLKANFILTVLVLISFFLLKQTKNFQLNRLFLLGVVCISLVSPFLPEFAPIEVERPKAISLSINEVMNESPTFQALPISKGIEVPTVKENTAYNSLNTFHFTYWLVSFIFFLFFLNRIFKVCALKRRSQQLTFEGKSVFISTEIQSFFSFNNWIFLNKKWLAMPRGEKQVIIQHEMVHVKQRHSFDILLVEALKVFLWFNPAIWILKNLLQLQHEFYVDEQVKKTFCASTYSELLLKLARNNQQRETSLVNSISTFSTLQKRIHMMASNQKNKFDGRYIVLFSVAILAIFLSSFKEVERLEETIINSIQKKKELDLDLKLNGTMVDFKKGFQLESLFEEGRADFDVKLPKKYTQHEKVVFTLSYGRKKLKEHTQKLDGKQRRFKFSIPELTSYEFMHNKMQPDIDYALNLIVQLYEDALSDNPTQFTSQVIIPINTDRPAYDFSAKTADKILKEIEFDGKLIDISDGVSLKKLIADDGKLIFRTKDNILLKRVHLYPAYGDEAVISIGFGWLSDNKQEYIMKNKYFDYGFIKNELQANLDNRARLFFKIKYEDLKNSITEEVYLSVPLKE